MNDNLWDNEDIDTAVLLIENRYGTEASMMAAKELRVMRSGYETRIQILEAQIKRMSRRISILEGEPVESEYAEE